MFLEHYKLYWTNYANFRGRTPRAGYWFVFLWSAIINIALFLITLAVGGSAVYSGLYESIENPLAIGGALSGMIGAFAVLYIITVAWGIANIIPGLSIMIRRFHDTGRRWPWIFIYIGPVIAFVLLFILALVTLNMGILFVCSVIMPFVMIACCIITLVILCLPTSPNAIGQSTHGMYPQWQDGYGSSAGRSRGAGESAAAIVGISGMYRGVEFPLDDDEELVIGRDAMLAHIVITQGAEKVSRKHLAVSYDTFDHVYMVTDHSSNGTYLADGTRLVANIPVKLQRGTVFYLAKKENSFKLV